MVAGPYLLDTSTLIWLIGRSERLSRAARAALIHGPRVLSVVSFWKIVVKAGKAVWVFLIQ